MNNNINDEISYITFVLGYDLLRHKILDSNYRECDIVYDICTSIAKLFLKSDEYLNTKYSTYEMLDFWLRINDDIIDSYFIGGNK